MVELDPVFRRCLLRFVMAVSLALPACDVVPKDSAGALDRVRELDANDGVR